MKTYVLINRSLSTAIDKKTSSEVWSNTYVDARVDNGKLEPIYVKYIFLGYTNGVKRYKLWCPKTSKIIACRDVIFDKSVMLRDSPTNDS